MKRLVLALVTTALAMSQVAPALGVEMLFRVADVGMYDAAGKRVSTVTAAMLAGSYPLATSANVAFRTETGKLVLITATGPGLFGTGQLYFASTDCTGRPFLSRPSPLPALYGGASLVGERKTLYVQTGSDRSVVVRSTWRADGTCDGGFSTTMTGARAAAAGVDLADYFTPAGSARASRTAGAVTTSPRPASSWRSPTTSRRRSPCAPGGRRRRSAR